MTMESAYVFVILVSIAILLPLALITLPVVINQCTELFENMSITVGNVPKEKPKRKNDDLFYGDEKPKRKNDDLFVGDDGEIISLEALTKD
jgi:hypothetical protein